jgi:hypothetical protein
MGETSSPRVGRGLRVSSQGCGGRVIGRVHGAFQRSAWPGETRAGVEVRDETQAWIAALDATQVWTEVRDGTRSGVVVRDATRALAEVLDGARFWVAA